MGLTRRQEQFKSEYLVDLNATEAAIRAGYSKKTAYSHGQRLLKNVEIQAAIQEEMKKRSTRTEITSDQVLREIAKLSFSDVRGLFDEHGRLKPVHLLPDDLAAAVSSVEIVTKSIPTGDDNAQVEHTHKIKFWDKRGSLELLGKHLKLFTERIEHTGKDGGPIETKELSSIQRAARISYLLKSAKDRAKQEAPKTDE